MITKLKIKNKRSKIASYLILNTYYLPRRGQVMIIALVFLAVVLIIASSLFTRVADFIRFGSNSVMKEQATNLADAGLDYATQRLNDLAGAYPDLDGEGTDTQTLSTGQVIIQVTSGGTNLKKITTTGYIPNSTSPRAKRTIKADVAIDSTQIAFNYAVQVGTGGVKMENSSTIIGTVYSNAQDGAQKSIQGSGSSQINGQAWTVGTVSTPDPTVTCNQPPCKRENQQASQMPTVNYQEWEDAATLLDETNCSGTCTYSSGTPSLKGKYNGNLTLQNSAQPVMNGTIWVTGNVTIQNSAKLKLNDSFGSSGSVLLVDGTVKTENSGAFEPTNANPKGYILVISRSTHTTAAITVQNSGTNAIFYALEGGATMENSAKVTALIAKQLLIKNSATLTYDQGLADARFTSTSGGSWQIKKGTYKFTSSP